jgi:hypothetical protein
MFHVYKHKKLIRFSGLFKDDTKAIKQPNQNDHQHQHVLPLPQGVRRR